MYLFEYSLLILRRNIYSFVLKSAKLVVNPSMFVRNINYAIWNSEIN